jgi:hypothetical protein
MNMGEGGYLAGQVNLAQGVGGYLDIYADFENWNFL